MAGLLDFATDPQSAMMTQTALGLLSAGGPSLKPVSLGQAMGQAGQMGIQGYKDAQSNQMNQMKLDQLKRQLAFMQNMPSMKDPNFINQALQSGAVDLNTALPLMMKDNKNTWQDGGDKLIQLDAYGQPTGQSMPKGLAPSIHFVDQGGKVTPTLIQGGEVKPIGSLEKTASPDALLSQSTAIRGQNMTDKRSRELNGIMENGQLSQNVETAAQAIANGQLPALSGFAMKTPYGQQTMARVLQINPQYNAADFNSNQTGLKQFTSGKLGNSVRSFNVSISHLNTLEKLSDALNNGDVQAVNKIGNYLSTQTGAPAPTDFNAAKKIVGDEIVKAIVGAGGALADREEAAKTVSAANSPAQLKGVINTYKELMNGQLKGLQQQYEQSTGRKDFTRFLSDESQSEFNGANQAGNIRKYNPATGKIE